MTQCSYGARLELHTRHRVAQNPYQNQDHYKRVLTICSAGCLRAPTAAFVLSQEPYNYNTRPAGAVDSYAIVKVDEVLLAWADEIVVMGPEHIELLHKKWRNNDSWRYTPKYVLGIKDEYAYRAPQLIEEIKWTYDNRTQFDDSTLDWPTFEEMEESALKKATTRDEQVQMERERALGTEIVKPTDATLAPLKND